MKIKQDSRCSLCGKAVETWIHIFKECPYVAESWKQSTILLDWQARALPPDQWLQESHRTLPNEDFPLLLAHYWLIWRNRNTAIYQGTKQERTKIATKTKEYLCQYHSALEPTESNSSSLLKTRLFSARGHHDSIKRVSHVTIKRVFTHNLFLFR